MTEELDGARLEFVPLSLIRYNPAINARRDTETDVSELAATIDAKKIGQPLLLRPVASGHYEPVDGGRRFRALCKLQADGRLDLQARVPAIIRELTDDEALTLSLSTAITRLDLNPADEALSFADLARMGHDADEIAAIFGVPVRRVRQRLAIGQLPRDIVDALRKGDLDLKDAQAYTLLSDPAQALKLFKQGIQDSWQIQNHFTKSRVAAESREAAYVGEAAYRAAGGAVDEDLFSNNRWFADGKLLAKLFEKKLKADEKQWLDEGWSFVIIDTESWNSKTAGWGYLEPEGKPNLSKEQQARAKELRGLINAAKKKPEPEPRMGEWQKELDEITARFFTDAQKKKSGVVVRYLHNTIEVQFGKMKPAQAAKEKKAKASKQKSKDTSGAPSTVRPVEPEAEADFTGALQAEMAKAMTHAMQSAIIMKPLAALRLAAAVLMQMADFQKPEFFCLDAPQKRFADIAQATADNADAALAPYSEADGDDSVLKEFKDLYPALETADAERLTALIAHSLAPLFVVKDSVPDELAPLIVSLDPDVATIWEPTEEFFKRMPRESLAAALGEAAVPGVSASKKKKELVEMALKSLLPVGWLPKPLRTPSYEGPGSTTWIEAREQQLADEAVKPQQEQAA